MTTRRSSYLVAKAFRGFLLASVLTAAASQVGTLIDGLMLSHFINAGAMSAINLTSPVSQTLFALCSLLGVGGSMLAGIAIGNHDRAGASSLFSTVAATAVALGLAIAAAGTLCLDPLTRLLCPEEALRGYTADYLRVIILAAPVYMLMVVLQMFVTLDGAPKRVTLAVCLSMVFNLGLDYVTIVVFGWSMTGAAIATVTSWLVALAVLAPHFARPDTLRFAMPRTVASLGRITSMGLPFGIATALIAVQILGNNLVAMRYLGETGIVTLSICLYLLMFSMIILTGALESFQPVAAILKGSGDNRGVALVLGRAYRFLGVSLSLLALLLIFCPGFIAMLFGIDGGDALAMIRRALPAYAANILLQCSIYLLIPVYQIYSHKGLAYIISFGQPLLPMLCFWLMSWLAARGADVNPWWGFAIGQAAVALILLPFALAKRGGHMPLVLIDTDNPDELFDISIAPSLQSMNEALTGVDDWMRRRGFDPKLCVRVQLACEESVKNIIEHALARKSRSRIDLRVAVSSGSVRAVIRDEGAPFNPVESDPGTGLGLMLVRKTCDAERYEYLFHQNILTIEWTI